MCKYRRGNASTCSLAKKKKGWGEARLRPRANGPLARIDGAGGGGDVRSRPLPLRDARLQDCCCRKGRKPLRPARLTVSFYLEPGAVVPSGPAYYAVYI